MLDKGFSKKEVSRLVQRLGVRGVRGVMRCQSPGVTYSRNLFGSDGSKVHYSRYHTILDCDICSSCDGTGYFPLRVGVELAAYCGDEVSRLALCWKLQAETAHGGRKSEWYSWPGVLPLRYREVEVPIDFGRWLCGLDRWGQGALVRAAVAVAWCVLSIWGMTPAPVGGPVGSPGEEAVAAMAPRLALEAVEAWLVCPCDEHLEVAQSFDKLPDFIDELPLLLDGDEVPMSGANTHLQEIVSQCACFVSPAVIRDAICARLILWALEEK